MRDETSRWIERQLTSAPSGHTLNRRQVITADGAFAAYDNRNDDSQIISATRIGLIDIDSGETRDVYSVESPNAFGPGVGAVACHPNESRMIFIHGLRNCDSSRPYGVSRRFGAILEWDSARVDSNVASSVATAETRCFAGPWCPGMLRGGTHAHSWSGDGMCLSFTYNDALAAFFTMEDPSFRDLRTVGVMIPGEAPAVGMESDEEFNGRYFSVIVAAVTDTPTPGSDEIEVANEECWIGKGGYQRADGTIQEYAIAYQGFVRDERNQAVPEVFVVDLPPWHLLREHLCNDAKTLGARGAIRRLPTPSSLKPRRLTFTTNRSFPGVQGPRNWLVSTNDGAKVLFPMRDRRGIAQIACVPTTGGDIHLVSDLEYPIEGQIALSKDGNAALVCSNGSVVKIDLNTGVASALTKRLEADNGVEGAVHETRDGCLIYNRYVSNAAGRHLQVFKLSPV